MSEDDSGGYGYGRGEGQKEGSNSKVPIVCALIALAIFDLFWCQLEIENFPLGVLEGYMLPIGLGLALLVFMIMYKKRSAR